MAITLRSMINRTHPFLGKVEGFLIQWRKVILAVLTLSICVMEIIEHPDFLLEELPYFYLELGIYIGLLFIASIMIDIAMRAVEIKNQTINILDTRRNLSLQFSGAKDWDETLKIVLQYPSSFAPVLATSLLIFNPDLNEYRTERSWTAPKTEINIQKITFPGEACCAHDLHAVTAEIHQVDCKTLVKNANRKYACYHITLQYGNAPVGILNIVMPENRRLKSDQTQWFSNTAEDIAIGLSAAKQRQEQHAIEVVSAASNERLAIARDLHDTLGQNLGYLHFKLDQILIDNDTTTCPATRTELEGLRNLANESYELVRNTLVILHHKTDHAISELFNAHAQIIAKRTGISVSVNEEGLPRLISPDHLKQLLHAFKESLYNIEKHSGASEAKVCLSWTDTHLKVRIGDNGRGFDIKETTNHGHYGLHIIDERIQSLGGKTEINSAPGEGTEILLLLPLDVSENEQLYKTGEL
jgi:signal transduction histidine kinase